MTVKQWNKVAPHFLTQSDAPSADAAENEVILWPEILPQFQELPHGARILDFGCGTGAFCQKLHDAGFEPVGVDSSEDMLRLAKDYTSSSINYFLALKDVSEKLDAVVSIHALEFVADIEAVIENLASSLVTGGIVVIAVHAPEYIDMAIQKNMNYQKCADGSIVMVTNGQAIPIHPRTSENYDTFFAGHGCRPIAKTMPLYSESFKNKYGVAYDLNYWAMVLTYKKTG